MHIESKSPEISETRTRAKAKNASKHSLSKTRAAVDEKPGVKTRAAKYRSKEVPGKQSSIDDSEVAATSSVNPRADFCSRLFSAALHVSSNFSPWANELYQIVSTSRDFKLMRQLAKSKMFSSSLFDDSRLKQLTKCLLTTSVNPTAGNIFLYHKTDTCIESLNNIRECLRTQADSASPSSHLEVYDTFLKTLLPKTWAVVHFTEVKHGAVVNVSTCHQSHSFSLSSLKSLAEDFAEKIKQSVDLNPLSDRQEHWNHRFSCDEQLAEIVDKIDLELAPLSKLLTSKCRLVDSFVLIADECLSQVPWEHTGAFKLRSVGRYPSMEFFMHHFNMVKHRVDSPKLKTSNTFYVVNPSGDLKITEATFEQYFTSLLSERSDIAVSGIMATEPSLEIIKHQLESCDLFLYCGHGSGSKYYPAWYLRSKLPTVNGAVLLFGCASGKLASLSPNLDPTTIPYDFLLCGAPAVVANLWSVTDREIDRLTVGLLKDIFAQKPNGNVNPKRNSNSKSLTLSLMIRQLTTCVKLPVTTGYAPVVYGLPNLKFE